jgi:hypothetical protein
MRLPEINMSMMLDNSWLMIWEMLDDNMEKAGEALLRVASPLSPRHFARPSSACRHPLKFADRACNDPQNPLDILYKLLEYLRNIFIFPKIILDSIFSPDSPTPAPVTRYAVRRAPAPLSSRLSKIPAFGSSRPRSSLCAPPVWSPKAHVIICSDGEDKRAGAEMKTYSHPEVTTMRTTKSSVRSSIRSCKSTSQISKGIPDVKGIPGTSCIPGASALKGISNKALLSGIRRLSETERKTVLSILEHLIEIDRRGLYLPLGFSSLYEFCLGHLGYSEGTAVRRVNLARCIRDFPQSYRLLASGRISMSNVVKISKVIDAGNADALLSEIEGLSAREVDLIVSRHRPKSAIRDRVTPVYVKRMIEVTDDDSGPGNRFKQNTLPAGGRFSTINVDGKYPDTSTGRGDSCSDSGNGNESGEGPAASPVTGGGPLAAQAFVLEQRFEVKFGVDPAFLKKVARIRSLLSSKHHRHPELEELFSILMDEYIERHSPEGRIRRKTQREQRKAEKEIAEKKAGKTARTDKAAGDPKDRKTTAKVTAGGPQKIEGSRHIPRKVRDKVYARDKGCCSYRSQEGRKCGSTHDLQIDHIVPFARGGDSSPENLRLLCGKHNRLEAERAYGKKHMEQFVKESGEQYLMKQYCLEKTDMRAENPVKEDRGQYHYDGGTTPVPYPMKKPGRRASKLCGRVYFESGS